MGRAVQLALYSLAAHALGAEDARLTLLGFNRDMEPQFGLEDASRAKGFLARSARMQETGSFGMLGCIHKSFGFCPAYPLATLRSMSIYSSENGPSPIQLSSLKQRSRSLTEPADQEARHRFAREHWGATSPSSPRPARAKRARLPSAFSS